ncbi:substrate-binding periplasmic protein [Chitinibacteraceae bacterium HSL-7]
MLRALLALFAPLLASAETLTVYGDEAYPPYAYVEHGEYKGIYVDLLRAISPRLGTHTLDVKPLPWKRALAELETGHADAIFPPYFAPSRSHFIARYSTPLMFENVVLICRRDVMQYARTRFPDDYQGLAIGINAGFWLVDPLQAAAKRGLIRLVPNRSNEANLAMLSAKRIDCYANDRLSIRYALQHTPMAPDVVETLTLATIPAFVAYGNTLPASALDEIASEIDRQLREAQRSGLLERLKALYAPF